MCQKTSALWSSSFKKTAKYSAEIIFSEAVLNTIPVPLELALFTPSGVCFLAASFFRLRRFMGYELPKV